MTTVLAPWLQLPDFQQSMIAGARIGQQQAENARDAELKREQIAQAAAEAAGKLGLGYAHLQSERQSASDEAANKRAALALTQSHYTDLSKIADQRHDLGSERLTALEQNRDVVNALRERGLDQSLDLGNRRLDLGEKTLESTDRHRQAIEELRTRALEQGDQRLVDALDIAQQRMAVQREVQDRIDARTRPPAKPKVGMIDLDVPTQVPGTLWGHNTVTRKVKSVPINDPLVNQVLGNVPGFGTNHNAGATAPSTADLVRSLRGSRLPDLPGTDTPANQIQAPLPQSAQPSAPSTETIRVKSPDGKFGYLPYANWEQAKKAGYEEAPLEPGAPDER